MLMLHAFDGKTLRGVWGCFQPPGAADVSVESESVCRSSVCERRWNSDGTLLKISAAFSQHYLDFSSLHFANSSGPYSPHVYRKLLGCEGSSDWMKQQSDEFCSLFPSTKSFSKWNYGFSSANSPLQSNRLHANPTWSNRIRPWYPEQQRQRSVLLCDLGGSLSWEHLFINNRNTMKDFVPLQWRLREKLFFILTLKLRLSLEQRNKLIWLNLDLLAQTDQQETLWELHPSYSTSEFNSSGFLKPRAFRFESDSLSFKYMLVDVHSDQAPWLTDLWSDMSRILQVSYFWDLNFIMRNVGPKELVQKIQINLVFSSFNLTADLRSVCCQYQIYSLYCMIVLL